MSYFGAGGFTQVRQATLHWRDRGRGRPVVLLHGLADCHRTWRHLACSLPLDRYRLLMLDLPGHGLSSRTGSDYSLDWHADAVGQLIDSLGIDTFDVIGHSFGGGVAQALLLSHGSRIQRLALVAPGGLGRDVAWGVRLLTLPGAGVVTQPFLGIGTRIALGLSLRQAFDPAERQQLAWLNARPGTAQALARTARGIATLGGQSRHFLDQARAVPWIPPVALYWGSRDPVIPVTHGAAAVRFLPGATLTVFRNCGHFPHLETPAGFENALSTFLEDRSLRPTRIAVPPALPPRRPWWRRFAAAMGRLANAAFGRRVAA